MLDANSAVMTAKLDKGNSAVMTAELLTVDNEIDIFPLLARACWLVPFKNRACSATLSTFFVV